MLISAKYIAARDSIAPKAPHTRAAALDPDPDPSALEPAPTTPGRLHCCETVSGGTMRTLIEGDQSAGVHEVAFNAAKISSGVCFYRLRAGNFIETRKPVVAK